MRQCFHVKFSVNLTCQQTGVYSGSGNRTVSNRDNINICLLELLSPLHKLGKICICRRIQLNCYNLLAGFNIVPEPAFRFYSLFT